MSIHNREQLQYIDIKKMKLSDFKLSDFTVTFLINNIFSSHTCFVLGL